MSKGRKANAATGYELNARHHFRCLLRVRSGPCVCRSLERRAQTDDCLSHAVMMLTLLRAPITPNDQCDFPLFRFHVFPLLPNVLKNDHSGPFWPRHLALLNRTASPPATDSQFLLDFEQTAHDPLAQSLVGPHRLAVEELREGPLDALVDAKELCLFTDHMSQHHGIHSCAQLHGCCPLCCAAVATASLVVTGSRCVVLGHTCSARGRVGSNMSWPCWADGR